jgi:hypothetical protein
VSKLTTVWLVKDPTPESKLADIYFEATIPFLVNYILGTGNKGQWEKENTTIYDNMGEAQADAKRRMRRRVTTIAASVAVRYLTAVDSEIRQEAINSTHPINKPKGIAPDIVSEHGRSVNHRSDITKPEKDDLRPEDVFAGTPNQMGVRNLAETGEDLTRALSSQVPKDKGHDVVHNLSQYLIETKGGGSGGPEGRKG